MRAIVHNILTFIMLTVVFSSCIETDTETNTIGEHKATANTPSDSNIAGNDSVLYPSDWPLPDLDLPEECKRIAWPYNETRPSKDGFTYSLTGHGFQRSITCLTYEGDAKDLISHIDDCTFSDGFIRGDASLLIEMGRFLAWERSNEQSTTNVFLNNLTDIGSNVYSLGIDVITPYVIDE